MKQILRTIVVVWSVLAGLTAWGQGDYVKPALTIDEVVVAPETKPWAFPTHEAPQVDPSSGSGSMAVELFSWNVGKFPMSISLGYALGGHKMEEKSGLIGLGWRLSCAGMVYRDVAGLPDESKQFLFLSSEEIDSRESNDMSSDDRLGGGARYLDQVERRDVDALYDRYHYQFPGHSGSFIIKNGAVIMLPQDNVTITLFGDTGIDNVKNFRITTPDGTKYEFSEREHTDYVHPLSGTKPGYSGLTYYNAVTKWHLKRIITPEGVDTITYHYDTLPLWNINRNHSSQSYG
ncbi:MAG: hypothetical protein K2O88_05925, partial [Paramuribaculum sp.]|nr:hypothetical protein [Paramuribaculum sp.]